MRHGMQESCDRARFWRRWLEEETEVRGCEDAAVDASFDIVGIEVGQEGMVSSGRKRRG